MYFENMCCIASYQCSSWLDCHINVGLFDSLQFVSELVKNDSMNVQVPLGMYN